MGSTNARGRILVGRSVSPNATELPLRTLLILLLVYWCIGCSDSGNANYDALTTKKISCQGNATAEYSGWGPHGMQEVCKLKHGPFVAAEGGRVVLEGEYDMNKPSGVWKWYDEGGKVYRTEKY